MPVSLPANLIETHSIGGSVVATVDAAAISNGTIDFLNGVIAINFIVGTPVNNSFAASQIVNKQFRITIDTGTGNWNTSAGTSGTLTAPQLTQLLTNQKALKNGVEQLGVAVGLLPGVFTAWV